MGDAINSEFILLFPSDKNATSSALTNVDIFSKVFSSYAW